MIKTLLCTGVWVAGLVRIGIADVGGPPVPAVKLRVVARAPGFAERFVYDVSTGRLSEVFPDRETVAG